MLVNSVVRIRQINNLKKNKPTTFVGHDVASFENQYINKKPLIDRGIIKQGEDVNKFFDNISSEIFPSSPNAHAFSQALKMGYISLSSSCYSDLKKPYSAIGLKLNKNESPTKHLAQLEEHVASGRGVGVNFSNFDNPISEIKKINSYFKFRESTCKRPPAGIALLNINHPKILDFISLKDNALYQDWCFDLSVVIPQDFISKVDNNENLTLQDGTSLNARVVYNKLLNSMQKKGEPGIIFSNKQDYICDCCACTELYEKEGLTLGQINLAKFYNLKTNKIDYDFMQNCAVLLSQAMNKIDKNSYIGILGYKTLLDSMQLQYGSKEANDVLDKSMGLIAKIAHDNNLKVALSPTGTISRMLNVTPSIEPVENQGITYFDEIDVMSIAQKYCDGNISKTINLKQNHTIEDVDSIVRYCSNRNIKGISIFPCKAI